MKTVYLIQTDTLFIRNIEQYYPNGQLIGRLEYRDAAPIMESIDVAKLKIFMDGKETVY